MLGIYASYYRQGTACDWWYFAGNKIYIDYRDLHDRIICPLTEHERQAFDQARDAELQRLAAAGIQYKHRYGTSFSSRDHHPDAVIRDAVTPDQLR